MDIKYSWEHIDKGTCNVFHTENGIKTLIATTDNVEKAHFIAYAANFYHAFGKQYVDEKTFIPLKEANEILRSCHAVAERKGVSTNWEALEKRIMRALTLQHPILYGVFSPLHNSEQSVPVSDTTEAK